MAPLAVVDRDRLQGPLPRPANVVRKIGKEAVQRGDGLGTVGPFGSLLCLRWWLTSLRLFAFARRFQWRGPHASRRRHSTGVSRPPGGVAEDATLRRGGEAPETGPRDGLCCLGLPLVRAQPPGCELGTNDATANLGECCLPAPGLPASEPIPPHDAGGLAEARILECQESG